MGAGATVTRLRSRGGEGEPDRQAVGGGVCGPGGGRHLDNVSGLRAIMGRVWQGRGR